MKEWRTWRSDLFATRQEPLKLSGQQRTNALALLQALLTEATGLDVEAEDVLQPREVGDDEDHG
jgi:hypothetical protein